MSARGEEGGGPRFLQRKEMKLANLSLTHLVVGLNLFQTNFPEYLIRDFTGVSTSKMPKVYVSCRCPTIVYLRQREYCTVYMYIKTYKIFYIFELYQRFTCEKEQHLTESTKTQSNSFPAILLLQTEKSRRCDKQSCCFSFIKRESDTRFTPSSFFNESVSVGPASPALCPASPAYCPASPAYCPASPAYCLASSS